jgi:ligand-binding sensor protein
MLSQDRARSLLNPEHFNSGLPLLCVQSIQDVFAEVVEVAALTADKEGKPISEISNACEFCRLILDSPLGLQACISSWRLLALQSSAAPIFAPCHAGLLYARARIDVGDDLIAILVAGQFYAEKPSESEELARIKRLSSSYQIEFSTLLQAARAIPILEKKRILKISSWLEKVASSFQQIGAERGELIGRLHQIAAMSLYENS